MYAKKQLRQAARAEWDEMCDTIGGIAAACRRSVDPTEAVEFAIQVYAETVVALERGDLEAALEAARAKK